VSNLVVFTSVFVRVAVHVEICCNLLPWQ